MKTQMMTKINRTDSLENHIGKIYFSLKPSVLRVTGVDKAGNLMLNNKVSWILSNHIVDSISGIDITGLSVQQAKNKIIEFLDGDRASFSSYLHKFLKNNI